jgi:hypothetical protein
MGLRYEGLRIDTEGYSKIQFDFFIILSVYFIGVNVNLLNIRGAYNKSRTSFVQLYYCKCNCKRDLLNRVQELYFHVFRENFHRIGKRCEEQL